MNIIIYGTKKCNDTKKAQRFFKERNIPFHFRDLAEKGLAKGELNNIASKIQIEDLIDKEG
ncbi:MAG TPA: ArsC family transcriptional regulator, partial [Ignavibacteria bacterium]|nr:ArsC family transcriptional regulator [Ignavibacteria bacterium]